MTVPLPLEFRGVGPDLCDELAAFFADLCANGDERLFHPHPLTADYAAKLGAYAGRDLYYVAAGAGRVLAYGLLRGWDEGYSVPSLGIAVHPKARGTGVARPFMQFLHAAAAARGAPRVRLKVYPDNTRARRLYEGLGYQFEPTAGDQLLGVLKLRDPVGEEAGRCAERIKGQLTPGPAGPAPSKDDPFAAVRDLFALDDTEFVKGCYQLLLGRAADAGGLAHYRGALAAGALTRNDLIRTLATRDEGRQTGNDFSWLPRLERRGADAAFAAVRDLWRKSDEEFLRGLYRLLLERDPDASGLEHYKLVLLGGRPRTEVVREIARGPEAAATGLDTSWLGRLDDFTADGIWRRLHELWPLPDGPFVEGLYPLLLGRPADPAGLEHYRTALATGALTRTDVTRLMAISPEAGAARLDITWLPRLGPECDLTRSELLAAPDPRDFV